MGQLEVRNSREAASVKPHLTGLLLSQPPTLFSSSSFLLPFVAFCSYLFTHKHCTREYDPLLLHERLFMYIAMNETTSR